MALKKLLKVGNPYSRVRMEWDTTNPHKSLHFPTWNCKGKKSNMKINIFFLILKLSMVKIFFCLVSAFFSFSLNSSCSENTQNFFYNSQERGWSFMRKFMNFKWKYCIYLLLKSFNESFRTPRLWFIQLWVAATFVLWKSSKVLKSQDMEWKTNSNDFNEYYFGVSWIIFFCKLLGLYVYSSWQWSSEVKFHPLLNGLMQSMLKASPWNIFLIKA